MKKTIITVLIPIIFLNCTKTDREILDETISRLNELNQIEYDVRKQYLSKSFNQKRDNSGTCYFDFSSRDTLIETKYRITYENGETVFNGEKQFSSQDKEELVLYTKNPIKRQVISAQFLLYSVFSLRKLLPKIMNDSTINITRLHDTIIQNNENFMFNIHMKNKYVDLGGELTKMNEEENEPLNYILCISKKDYLPNRFGNFLANDNGYNFSTFSNFRHSKTINDSLWEYSRFPKSYFRSTYLDYFKTLSTKDKEWIGLEAPDWELSSLTGDTVKLSDLKEKLVLLEFWFPYCKGCVQASSTLNELRKKYSKERLAIYGIEYTNVTKNALIEYSEKQKIDIPTLFNGKSVSKDYGIWAAPTFFLIDRKGEIVYTSAGLNQNTIIEEIEKRN